MCLTQTLVLCNDDDDDIGVDYDDDEDDDNYDDDVEDGVEILLSTIVIATSLT